MSWLRRAAGYVVLMNRDERPSRAPGLPPREHARDGVRWLAPEDGDHFGTWIGVNDRGLTVALTNRWDESPLAAEGTWTSRGHLVTALLSAPSPRALARALATLDLPRYRPFTLATFAPDADVHLHAWNGQQLEAGSVVDSGLVVASSGFDQDGASRSRGALLSAASPSAEAYEALHRSHLPARGALSICMHREEAATVSLVRVDVTRETVIMTYVPGPPCTTARRMEQQLPRATPQPSG